MPPTCRDYFLRSAEDPRKRERLPRHRTARGELRKRWADHCSRECVTSHPTYFPLSRRSGYQGLFRLISFGRLQDAAMANHKRTRAETACRSSHQSRRYLSTQVVTTLYLGMQVITAL